MARPLQTPKAQSYDVIIIGGAMYGSSSPGGSAAIQVLTALFLW